MKIDEFVKGYKSLVDDINKQNYILDHIKKKYVSIIEKMAKAKAIAKNSMYTTVLDGTPYEKEVFSCNTNFRYINYVLAIIEMYTDIEVEWNDHINDQFDMLAENHLIEPIIALIDITNSETMTIGDMEVGDSEINFFNKIVQSAVDDMITNETNPVNALEKKISSVINSITIVAETAIKKLDTEDKSAIKSVFSDIINALFK